MCAVSRWRRHRGLDRGDDRGTTLIEVIVAMSIFSVIITIFGVAVTQWTQSIVRGDAIADQTSAARTAFDFLDRQVPAASAVNYPVLSGSSWYLEFRTDATSPSTCTQWRLDTDTQLLQWRTWPTDTGVLGTPTAWRTAATGVVNSVDPSQKPFSMDKVDAQYAQQRLDMRLRLQQSTGPVTQSNATFTARNTSPTTQTDADVNNDGVSDNEVCTDISGTRRP